MAAAAVHNTNDDGKIKCPSCLEQMLRPAILTCSHLFCEQCLQDMKIAGNVEGKPVQYKCIICDVVTQNDDVQSLDMIKKIHDKQGLEHSKVKCTACKDNMAVGRCNDCKANYCKACKVLHDNVPTLNSHTWSFQEDEFQTTIDEVMLCEEHSGKHFQHFCFDCKVLLCHMCVSGKHRGHSLDDTAKALGDVLLAVDERNKNLESTRCENKKMLEAFIKHSEDAKKLYEDIEKKIDLETTSVIEKAKDDQRVAKEKLSAIRNKHQCDMSDAVKRLENKVECQFNVQKIIMLILDKVKDVSLLQIMHAKVIPFLDGNVLDLTKDNHELWRMKAVFTERPKMTGSIIGEVIDDIESCFTNIRPEFSHSVQLENNVNRFLINDHQIIAFRCNHKPLYILSHDGLLTREITIDDIASIRALAKTPDQYLVSSGSGLYSVSNNWQVVKKLWSGRLMCGLSISDGWVYALDNGRKRGVKINLLAQSSNNVELDSFDIDGYVLKEHNTVQATTEHLYIALYSKDCILKYDKHGNFITKLGTPGTSELPGYLSQPSIWGVDAMGTLLIVDEGNGRLQTLTHDVHWQVLELQGLVKPTCAAVHGKKLYVLDNSTLKVFI